MHKDRSINRRGIVVNRPRGRSQFTNCDRSRSRDGGEPDFAINRLVNKLESPFTCYQRTKGRYRQCRAGTRRRACDSRESHGADETKKKFRWNSDMTGNESPMRPCVFQPRCRAIYWRPFDTRVPFISAIAET